MAQTPCKKVQAGSLIPDPSTTTRTVGDVVVLGSIPLIVAACDPNLPGKNTLASDEIYDVPKDTSTFTAGDAVYWDDNGSPVTGTALSGAASSSASGNNLMGFATEDAATGASYVRVKQTAAKRTTTIAGSVTADDITGSDSSLGITGAPPATTSSAGGAVVGAGGIGGSVSGAGGAVSWTGGAGTTNAAGGTGTFSGGAGNGTGAGGAVTTRGGASGAGATGNGGAWSGGGGAALSTNGTGGAASLTGGVATGTGTGGALTLTSGASAGASGTAGACTLDAGAAAGGTGAAVEIGPTNATSVKIGAGGAERAAVKGVYYSGTIAVTVPSITDPDIAKVDVSLAAMTFAPAVGDAVIPIPLEALPTNCRLQSAWINATDQVQVTFGSEGGNVTGAAKNFGFVILDLT